MCLHAHQHPILRSLGDRAVKQTRIVSVAPQAALGYPAASKEPTNGPYCGCECE